MNTTSVRFIVLSLLSICAMTACEEEEVAVKYENGNFGEFEAANGSSKYTNPQLDNQADGDTVRVISAAEEARMQRYVDRLVDSSHILKSYTTSYGEQVDCVDIYNQPALKQPGMEDHVIKFAPETLPKNDTGDATEDAVSETLANEKEQYATQEAVGQGESNRCPENSIPMLRLTMDTLRRFRTLDDFRKKVPSHIMENYNGPTTPAKTRDIDQETVGYREEDGILLPRTGPTSLHQYAHAYRSQSNRGLEGIFNVWKPYVYRTNEFSLVQMWNVRGSGSNRETVEGGIQTYKALYGDKDPRLFIYFTPDNYGSGGCYNTSCGKFVQVSSSVLVGGKLANYSTTDGTQYTLKILWLKDGANGHWWLRVGSTWVGYYPKSLFDSAGLEDYGAKLDFGGEIIDQQYGERHTYTDMGSGAFPSAGFAKAAYVRSLKYVDFNNYYQEASNLIESRTDSHCYDIEYVSGTGSWGKYFYYGGPGRNADCE